MSSRVVPTLISWLAIICRWPLHQLLKSGLAEHNVMNDCSSDNWISKFRWKRDSCGRGRLQAMKPRKCPMPSRRKAVEYNDPRTITPIRSIVSGISESCPAVRSSIAVASRSQTISEALERFQISYCSTTLNVTRDQEDASPCTDSVFSYVDIVGGGGHIQHTRYHHIL